MSSLDLKALAREFIEARENGLPIAERPSDRDSSFSLAEAYAIGAELVRLRGKATKGRKVAFASKAMWRKLGIETVVWGPIYEDTLFYTSGNYIEFSLNGLVAPKLEPEILFKLKEPPATGIETAREVLESVEWLALGFELVVCPFPEWQYKIPDFVAYFGLHAASLVGEPLTVTPENIEEIASQLSDFKLKLYKNGEVIEEGGGKAVMGNPALSLAELANALLKQPGAPALETGEVITTGTLCTPAPVVTGDEFKAEVEGIKLPAVKIRFV